MARILALVVSIVQVAQSEMVTICDLAGRGNYNTAVKCDTVMVNGFGGTGLGKLRHWIKVQKTSRLEPS